MSRRKRKIGTPPGSLIFTGKQKVDQSNITVLQYNETQLQTQAFDPLNLIKPEPDKTIWYDIRGIHDVGLIENFGKSYSIHPLVLEDILSPHQRPKFEEYETGFFVVLKAISLEKDKMKFETEQIAIYAGDNFLLSFQEDAGDIFIPVRQRIESGRGKIRRRGVDYLAYALMDNIVDHYYVVLDTIEEIIDDLEDEIVQDPNNETKARIHFLKREMLTFRKSVTPLREAINRFSKSDHELVDESSAIFLRDLYDHVILAMDAIETYRDTLTGLQDLYISEISFKMNNVMQTLTIVATIFIPLTFLAGIYGMNFDNMPELHWKYGYFIIWGVMLLTTILLMYFFRKRKWL